MQLAQAVVSWLMLRTYFVARDSLSHDWLVSFRDCRALVAPVALRDCRACRALVVCTQLNMITVNTSVQLIKTSRLAGWTGPLGIKISLWTIAYGLDYYCF